MNDGADAADLHPGQWFRRAELRDGTPVLLRQLRPTDRWRIVDGMRELSPASRYLRFLRSVDHLTEAELDHLTMIDHTSHEAVIAIDLDRPTTAGVGIARYIKDPAQADIAEAAITVMDRYQGAGAGTLLVESLAGLARGQDVRTFVSYVLDGNRAMLNVFERLGATRAREADGLWRVELELVEVEASKPDDAILGPSVGRSVRRIARRRRRRDR